MKKLLLAASIVALTAGCSYSSVGGGVEGVMTYQPFVFGHGGVDSVPISTGATWTAWSTSVDRYNMKPVKYKETFVDLTADDNVAIDFDVYLTLKIQKKQSPVIHEEYGYDWYSNKVEDEFRAFVRNEARTRSSIDLRTNEQVIKESTKIIKDLTIAYFTSINLPVDVVKVNIGKVVPPEPVLKESAKTAAQKQRKQTEEQREIAELARSAAETASALADKAYAVEFGMTTDQFLQNKKLDIMLVAIKEGKEVSLIMNASEANPIFKVK